MVRQARAFIYLLRRRLTARSERDYVESSFALVERLTARLLPDYVLGDYGKVWSHDAAFLEQYRRLVPSGSLRSAERKFLLCQLLPLVAGLPGDTAEAGVYVGASSWFVCEYFRASGKSHYAFDSFAGLSAPGAADGAYWQHGDLASVEEIARARLEPFDAVICKGWIPDSFQDVQVSQLCFAHIDVDLYEPTLESIKFFYPRVVSGGIILCDDYGFATCPGARRAIDEYMADRPEPVVHVPTGQAVIIKR
jgi:O-methyltransferase